MVCKTEKKAVKRMSESEKYLHSVFSILKRSENLVISDKKAHFNDTELRLLGEVLRAKYADERLISTQLAKRLGVTRSAISQIVNRLESEGVVKRVPDDVDRKIAYIEVTDETMDLYNEELKTAKTFVNKVVKQFGTEKFDTMCELFDEFMNTLEEEKNSSVKKKKD